VAMLMDWNSWWALELASGPSRDMDFLGDMARWYRPFHARNIAVDIVNPAADSDYSGYALVVAPMLYMTKPGVAEALAAYVRGGGRLLATVMTGIADENDRCVFGAYPGKLRRVVGAWVEETDALRPEEANAMCVAPGLGLPRERYACGFLCDLLRLETAEPLAWYESDFYANVPCVTRNRFGQGTAWYVGTRPENAFMDDLVDAICQDTGISGLYRADAGVEITRRVGERGATVFMLNHSDSPAAVDLNSTVLTDLLTGEILTGHMEIGGRDVRVCAET